MDLSEEDYRFVLSFATHCPRGERAYVFGRAYLHRGEGLWTYDPFAFNPDVKDKVLRIPPLVDQPYVPWVPEMLRLRASERDLLKRLAAIEDALNQTKPQETAEERWVLIFDDAVFTKYVGFKRKNEIKRLGFEVAFFASMTDALAAARLLGLGDVKGMAIELVDTVTLKRSGE